MKRLWLLLMVLGLLGLPAAAARLGVVGVRTTDALLVRTAAQIADELTGGFVKDPQWTALTLPQVEKALADGGLTIAGALTNPEGLTAGRIKGVDYLLLGTLTRQGGGLRQDFRIVNTHTGGWSEASFYRQANQITQLIRDVMEFVAGQTTPQGRVVGRTGPLVQIQPDSALAFYPNQVLGVYRSGDRLSLGSAATLYGAWVQVGRVVVQTVGERQVVATITGESFGAIAVGDTIRPYQTGLGDLEIQSTPTNAAAYLNGQYVGNTPVTLAQIPAGTYQLSLSLPGYTEHRQQVSLKAGERARVNATLSGGTGTLVVESNISGQVYIDGQSKGRTPWSGQLAPGQYRVEIRATGYQSWSQTVTIQPGATQRVLGVLVGAVGEVHITSSPSGASVFIDGQYLGRTPLVLSRPAGRYSLRLTLSGYQAWEESINIGAGQTLRRDLQLRPLTGSLSVSSQPSSSDVFINGERVGRTPWSGELAPGQYHVEVRRSGFATWTQSVWIESGQSRSLQATLLSIPADLYLTSNPTGASISLDGRLMGQTPLTLQLQPGTYRIRLTRAGYQDHEEQITLTAGQARRVDINLRLLPGRVWVTSEPAGAEIYLGNQRLGITPTEIQLEAGTHRLRIVRSGYYEAQEWVHVTSNQWTQLTVRLNLQLGRLAVESTPNAAVYLDGAYRGQSPWSVDLPVGTYQLRLEAPGYHTHTQQVTIRADQTQRVSPNLRLVQGSLSVDSQPRGATLFIQGERVGSTPWTGELPPGEYRLRLELTGYEPWEEWVQIQALGSRSFQPRLTGYPGELNLTSTPPGARVLWDGREMGVTPLSFSSPAGSFTLKLTLPGYQDLEQRVTIHPGQSTRLSPELQRLPAVVSVQTQPSGAQVFVSGRYVGLTPTEISIPPGEVQIRLARTGYEEETLALQLEAGERAQLTRALKPQYGEVEVTSQPSGAQVFFGGQLQGETPLRLSQVHVGTVEVQVVLDGYQPAKAQVRVLHNQTQTLHLQLQSPYAALAQQQSLSLLVVYDSLQRANGMGLGFSHAFDDRLRLAGDLSYFPFRHNESGHHLPQVFMGDLLLDYRIMGSIGVWTGAYGAYAGNTDHLSLGGGVLFVQPLGEAFAAPVFRARAGLAYLVHGGGMTPRWGLEISLPLGAVETSLGLGQNDLSSVRFKLGLGMRL